ncbi:MAG: HipA domain-containing protein [Actinomycetota bacterium]|nr:HipA domain-containing protein [Actinomycetota bacterium]
MARPAALGVWMKGILVAELTAKRPWSIRCRYTSAAFDLAASGSPLLSCSLPLGSGRPDASVFVSGLLPEGQHRLAMAAQAGIADNDTFGLISRYGRDVAGALVIGAKMSERGLAHVEPYTASSLEAEVDGLPDRPLGLRDDSELSIAGIQNKLLLVSLPDGGWARPVHGAPSTHILKLDDERHQGLVAAEAACMRIAHAIGVTTVELQLEEIAGRSCLIVPRFDRSVSESGEIERVHQEDLCQATARDPRAERGRGKYQAAGGPSLSDTASVLLKWADSPETELRRLLRLATLNVAVGNADAHGKNVGLLHPTFRSVSLAPAYDVIPTVLWPHLRTRLAMSVNNRWEIDAVGTADLIAEATGWPLEKTIAEETVTTTLEAIAEATRTLDVDERVGRLARARSEALLDRRERTRQLAVGGGGGTGPQPRIPRGLPGPGRYTSRRLPEPNIHLEAPESEADSTGSGFPPFLDPEQE